MVQYTAKKTVLAQAMRAWKVRAALGPLNPLAAAECREESGQSGAARHAHAFESLAAGVSQSRRCTGPGKAAFGDARRNGPALAMATTIINVRLANVMVTNT